MNSEFLLLTDDMLAAKATHIEALLAQPDDYPDEVSEDQNARLRAKLERVRTELAARRVAA